MKAEIYFQGIGTAIGKFVGGIVGGFMSGVYPVNSLMARSFRIYDRSAVPFDGAASIDPAMLGGVKCSCRTIPILDCRKYFDGLTPCLPAEAHLSGFAEEMVPFGKP